MRKLQVVSVFALCVSAAAWAYIPPPPGLISLPVSQLSWQELAGSGGIKFANVEGSLTGFGPYEAFVRFPGGRDNPYHIHTHVLPTVVLEGTFYATIDGKTVDYPPGSYYRLPAKREHFSGCRPGPDCLLFQYQDDRFDLVPKPVAN